MRKLGGGAQIMHVLKEFGKGKAVDGLRRFGDERDADGYRRGDANGYRRGNTDGYRRGFRDGAKWMAQQFSNQNGQHKR